MTDDSNSKRWLPWTREKDTKAQLIAAIFGLLTAVVVSGTGYLRVDKFGLSDHIRSVETERLITRAEMNRAISDMKEECSETLGKIELRFDAIDRYDAETSSVGQTCREMLLQLREDHRRLSDIVHNFQRRDQ